MTQRLPLVWIVAFALLACQTSAARPARHGGSVQGTWTFVLQRGGQTLYKGTFTTDPARTPAHIDFRHTALAANAGSGHVLVVFKRAG